MKRNPCGTEFEGTFCPECGTQSQLSACQAANPVATKPKKKKTSFFLRRWGVLPLAIVIGVMALSVGGCGEKPGNSDSQSKVGYVEPNGSDTTSNTNESTTDAAPSSTEGAEKTTKPSESSKPTESNLVNGMKKDFKESMDSYEEFMDDYVAFMKKYQANPSDLGLLADYATFMSNYADMISKFDKWENEELNDTELAYYLEVQTRVTQKLLEVAY